MGREPTETHEHYDAEDNYTGKTVVTREPEWDDEQRAWMLALAEYRTGVHDCGYHRSIAFDPANGFTFETETCPICAATALWNRRLADRDAREDEAAGREAVGARSYDGRSTIIRPLSDEEHAEMRAKREGRKGPQA